MRLRCMEIRHSITSVVIHAQGRLWSKSGIQTKIPLHVACLGSCRLIQAERYFLLAIKYCRTVNDGWTEVNIA
jgi:hypothetical protein